MASIANRFCLAVALITAGTASALAQAIPPQCGYERWPVKILSDKDRERVQFAPVEITIAKLVSIPIHEMPYPRDKRIAPEELTVYKIRGTLIEVRPEQDSDLHIIVADLDRPDLRMIVEIPAAGCAESTGREGDYSKAREVLAGVPKHSVIEITGVGFFDFIHNAIGTAKNGIELHPVLKIAAVKP